MNTKKTIYSDNSLGTRISAIRKLKKITREDMIKSLDVSHATLSRLENDSSLKITSDKLIKLSAILDVSCDYLLLGHEFIPTHNLTSIATEAYKSPEIYELVTLYQTLNLEDKTKALKYLRFLNSFKGEV